MGMSRVEPFPKAHAGIERGANQGVPRLDEPLYFVAMVVLLGLSLVPRLKTLAMAIPLPRRRPHRRPHPGHGQTTRACFRQGRQVFEERHAEVSGLGKVVLGEVSVRVGCSTMASLASSFDGYHDRSDSVFLVSDSANTNGLPWHDSITTSNVFPFRFIASTRNRGECPDAARNKKSCTDFSAGMPKSSTVASVKILGTQERGRRMG